MNKKQLRATRVLSVVICIFIFRSIQLYNFYSHGYRVKDKQGNIIHFVNVGKKDIWNDVLRNPVIAIIVTLSIGGLLFYALRDKDKQIKKNL